MATPNFMLAAQAQNTSDMLHRVIGNTFIIEYGIIKAIPAEGIVTVEMSVARKASEIVITDCILASFASSSFSVNIKPNINDKVIVLFPRKFNNDMFQADKDETIIRPVSSGYNIMSGIAILLNQFQPSTHKNFMQIENGKLTMELGYNEDEDKNMFEVTTDENGKIVIRNDVVTTTLDSDGGVTLANDKADITVDKDGKYVIRNDVVTVTLESDGGITLDNGKADITVDKNGNVGINAKSGKISIKNNSASLYSILNGMLTTLNSTLATAGSPASHTVVPNQFTQQSTQLGQLMQ